MPFLRVVRDKRGYETTYLMHWYREGNRQRSRILYIFRTPGGVRVGRQALEPEVLRNIEAQYPEIEFDWKAVLDNQQVVEPTPEIRRIRKNRRGEQDAEAPATAPAAPPAAEAQPRTNGAPAPVPIPAQLEGGTPGEQVEFLTTWYPRLRERIPQRISDPVRQEALLALAERLNPAGWIDADQIAAGLRQASEALDRLARVLSRRRRRSRKPARRAEDADPSAAPVPAPVSDDPREAPQPEAETASVDDSSTDVTEPESEPDEP